MSKRQNIGSPDAPRTSTAVVELQGWTLGVHMRHTIQVYGQTYTTNMKYRYLARGAGVFEALPGDPNTCIHIAVAKAPGQENHALGK